MQTTPLKQRIRVEAALLTGLMFIGLVLVPIAIYIVGQKVFGAYAGTGFGDFFGNLSQKIRQGDLVAWFLVLSPYLGWQCLRLMMVAWKAAGRQT